MPYITNGYYWMGDLRKWKKQPCTTSRTQNAIASGVMVCLTESIITIRALLLLTWYPLTCVELCGIADDALCGITDDALVE